MLIAALLVCVFIMLPSLRAWAVSPKNFLYSQPEIFVRNGIVSAALSLEPDNTEGLRDLLKAGSSVELKIRIIVERQRFLIPNAEISHSDFSFILRHDPLTREFTMALPGEMYPAFKDKNLIRLLDHTWKKLELPFGLDDRLQAEGEGEPLKVIINFALEYIELPAWLDKNMVMWSKDVLAPESLSLEYTPGGPKAR